MPTHPAAVAALRSRAAALVRALLAPPPKLTISTWADRHRYLSREASAEPGKWATERAPYLRGIMDAFQDPLVETVVLMKPRQVGATEVLNNAVGYYIDQDPAPILVVQPTVENGRAWSLDRLGPMLRDSPRLRGKVREPKTRDSGNTILHKTFAGGHITIVGANSAAGLAMRPIRIVLCDEVDRYPPSAGSEGDPVDLAVGRTDAFWNRKVYLASTPTTEGLSRIAEAYAASSQGHYEVPCVHCDAYQVLVWAQLKWEAGQPETAQYECAHCRRLLDESVKHRMLARGRWTFAQPGQQRVVGFHLNALYSPWTRWAELADQWQKAQGNRERLKVFINTRLAETWTDEAEQLDPEGLGARREQYPAEVPAGVGVLTAAIDVQANRLELLVRGWGVDEESWGIRQLRIYGDPAQDEVWERAEVELARAYAHELGATLRVRAVCVDSGDETESVYRFVRPRQSRGVHATKGISQYGRPLVTKPSKPNRGGVRVWPLGVDAGKDVLFRRLRNAQPGPGYLHFAATFDDEYFSQFGAEKVVPKFRRGRVTRTYVQAAGKRNEAIDLEVLALAALHILGPAVREHLDHWVRKIAQEGEAAGGPRRQYPPKPDDEPIREQLRRRRRPPGGGWINGWRR